MLRNFTGSTGIRAVIAVLMLLFVVACSGSDSGITRERDEARAAAEAAEQARMAAEAAAEAAAAEAAAQAEAARLAAEAAAEAAAQAEAARLAAEEAAAQAERDKQAAIEQARQEVIAQQERQSVMTAMAAAQAAVAALMDDSSDVDVAAASGAVASASATIAAATTFSADDTVMYTSQVTMVATALATAQANIRAYRAEMAAQAAMNQATASARAKQAVDEAIAALGRADEAEAMATGAYTAAAAALSAAQTAVGNADADTLADASVALSAALTQAAAAAAALGVKTQAVDDTTAALEAARATLAEVDPTHVALQAATEALQRAQTNANNQVEAIKALQKQIADLQQAEKDRMTDAERLAEEERMKAMAAKGKDLHKALGETPLANLGTDNDTPRAAISSAGLVLGVPTADDAAVVEPAQPMKAGDSAGSLGAWNGMHYAHTDTGLKVTNSAVVYTNRAAPTMKAFATGATFGADQGTFDQAYTSGTRTLDLGIDPLANRGIKGDMFPSAGTKNYPATVAAPVSIPGTYQGASGKYSCNNGCSAAVTASGIDLGGQWYFVHNPGALVNISDPTYLFFGWWLNTDDGKPTKASAFTGLVATTAATTAITPANLTSVVGSASYTGKAAGKFAINDPLNGGDAGHFTADAALTAKFSGSGAGVKGRINNFMANDNAVPWSVELKSAALSDNGEITSAADTKTTVWSIDGNSAPTSGTWNGQMYDEMPGDAPSGDGSDIPTSVTGMFESMFGSTHTMVGAFGATQE